MTTTAVETGVGVRERSPVLTFLARRIVGAVLALFAASIIIFAGTVLLPGDAAGVVLGRNATPEKVAQLNHQMHFDKPAYEDTRSWLGASSRATRDSGGRHRAGREERPDLAVDLGTRSRTR
jgi:peptide/nickel transport system permease protein